jgi:hypothetical protein
VLFKHYLGRQRADFLLKPQKRTLSMKYCPFCKNEIDADITQCPHCKRTLVEKFSSAKPVSEPPKTQPSPKETTTKTSYTHYTAAQKTSAPKKQFKLPKVNGWVITIVGSIALTAILNSGNIFSNLASTDPLPPPASTADTTANSIPVSSPSYNSLPNGKVLFSSPSLNGQGVLAISNGSGSDAVVTLITNGGVTVAAIYVDANASSSIKNISDGVYRVLFEFGSNWDPTQNTFSVNPSVEAFNDTFIFPSDAQGDGWSITLNPVAGGTATTNSLDPSEFSKYLNHD